MDFKFSIVVVIVDLGYLFEIQHVLQIFFSFLWGTSKNEMVSFFNHLYIQVGAVAAKRRYLEQANAKVSLIIRC